MMNIFHKLKPKGVPVLAFLLALVMLIGLIPFTATEVHAVEVGIEGKTTFTEGDEVLIVNTTSSEAKTSENKAIYTYTGGKWVPTSGTLVWEKDKKNTFEAYYPATVDFTLPTDQSEQAKLNAADRMVGRAESDPGESLSIRLSHYYAKVAFKVSLADEFDETDEISNLYVVTKDSSTTEVKAYCSAANSDADYHYDCSAYIPAGIYAVGDTFVKIDIGDKSLEAKMSEYNPLSLTAGTHYTFYLKVGKNKVTIGEVSTNDIGSPFGAGWDNDAEVGLDSSAASIGTQDVGKTNWVENDEIIVELYSSKYGTQYATLIYNGSQWNLNGSLLYLENEKPTVCAYYAPCNEVTGNTMNLRTGMLYGMTEYLEASDCQVVNNTISISFEGAIRNYSRLRIVGLPNQTLTVTTTGFTPAGASAAADGTTYTVTTNGDGNAYLYGTFAEGATVSVKYGNVVLKDYTFTADKHPNGTEHNKSYALDARPIIDGTLGGKATATEDDIKALVEQIKTYVDNGITTITVTGSNPAIIDMGTYTNTAIGEAIYRLSGSGYEQNSIYLGKIDLILPDVTEIVDWEFQKAYALNSINLPKVTTIGVEGIQFCLYLQKLTFGSVVTSIKDGTGFAFCDTGASVGGCHLVLNRGQASAATDYQPDPLNNLWWKTNWKYIELY